MHILVLIHIKLWLCCRNSFEIRALDLVVKDIKHLSGHSFKAKALDRDRL